MDAPCLVCNRSPTDKAHFPRTKLHGNATIRLCREHHTMQHAGDRNVMALLIERAPAYWKRTGQWEDVREEWDTWVSKRRVRSLLSL
jgi:hypothetical protein